MNGQGWEWYYDEDNETSIIYHEKEKIFEIDGHMNNKEGTINGYPHSIREKMIGLLNDSDNSNTLEMIWDANYGFKEIHEPY